MSPKSASVSLLAILFLQLPLLSQVARSETPDSEPHPIGQTGYVYEERNGSISCRPVSVFETHYLKQVEGLRLRELARGGLVPQAAGSINIVLRGTQQLDNFPSARQGFLTAVQTLTSRLQASRAITVVIDVDFGQTFFGQPYPNERVVGLTRGQLLGVGYNTFRTALSASGMSSNEINLYQGLPLNSVPADIGPMTTTAAQSPVLRSLGVLAAVADPAGEAGQIGAPPAIGFNSSIQFDFDPADGIDNDKIDFIAVALHEILHALGFGSLVGRLELDPSVNPAITPLDLFRFRPGAGSTPTGFTDAPRIQSSGGAQVFFSGQAEQPLSTGRPDASGGDGFQASHWQDDTILGRTIGIMDPQISRGERGFITDVDLSALDLIGFALEAPGGDPGGPSIKKVTFNGATMVIKTAGAAGQLQVMVNDVIVAPPLKIKIKAGGKKLKINGSAAQLNLSSGPNLVIVIANGLSSTPFTLNL
jgi:hypothetical protein